MSGPKKYKREDLLDRAIELFRRQGYADTSTAELVDALGVNRKSMYAEFGSKQDLFEAALERYGEVHLSRVLAPIEAPDADATSVKEAFKGYATAIDGRFAGLGCLMCNTAVERAALDPGSAKYVDAYLERLTSAFSRTIENGQSKGQIRNDVDVTDTAAFLTMSLVGVSALIRAKAPANVVHAASALAPSVLD